MVLLERCPECNLPLSHPLGLRLVGDYCSGCHIHREKYHIDWKSRMHDLQQIVLNAKRRPGKYDALVPISGDAEDYYVVRSCLELGLNILALCVNDYFKNDIGWRNIQHLITHFDIDSRIWNPSLPKYKDLVRYNFFKQKNVRLPHILLMHSYSKAIAYRKKIPLIIWGGSQATEITGKVSHFDFLEMSRWSVSEVSLGSLAPEKVLGGYHFSDVDSSGYKYPVETGKYGRGIYLSNFMKWDPWVQNMSTLEDGYLPQIQSRTFDPFMRSGCSVYYEIHDRLRAEKFSGYSKNDDHLAREIRHGRLCRSALKEKNLEGDLRGNDGFYDWLEVSGSGRSWLDTRLFSQSSRRLNVFEPDVTGIYSIEGDFASSFFVPFSKQIWL